MCLQHSQELTVAEAALQRLSQRRVHASATGEFAWLADLTPTVGDVIGKVLIGALLLAAKGLLPAAAQGHAGD